MWVNPMSLWLSCQMRALLLRWRYRGRHLHIGYMAQARRCTFGTWNRLYDYAVLTDVELGDMSYIARGARLANATVGRYTCIGPEALVGLGRHPTHGFVSSHPAFYSTRAQSGQTFVDTQKYEEFRPVTIGNDVWIGARAVVLDGATIGDGAIIAAGAVVSGQVPPYAIVSGVPATVVRYRFDEPTIAALRRSRWWDRSPVELRAHADAFVDAQDFLDDPAGAARMVGIPDA
jgi:acetyltransferase-like isoleucine patch superfamily enzyme